MRKILFISDQPGRARRVLRGPGASRFEICAAAQAGEALTVPGKEFAGVVWQRLAGQRVPAGLQAARRLRGDLPFIRLDPARASARSRIAAPRAGRFRRAITMPVSPLLLCHLIDQECSLMESEARLAAARARMRACSKRLSALADVAPAAPSVVEPAKVMEIVMSHAQDLIPTEAWAVFLVDDKEHRLSLAQARGPFLNRVKSYRIKIGQGAAGWVVQYKKALLINNVREDRRFDARFDMLTGFRTRSILSAPLISRGRIIGVVQMMNRRKGRFDTNDLAMLTTLVEPGAIALENATLYQKSAELTITDDLTKLFNSRYLNVHLRREIKRSRRYGVPVSLIFLDLDGFKTINDSFGHLAGSRALVEVGQVILETVREIDVTSRYGGDEFTVILPQTGASGAMIIAERIRRSIENQVFLKDLDHEVRLTASFGVATFPDHGETKEDLIQRADQAMYRIKDHNKNGVALALKESRAREEKV
ncbi:MAG: diguanylate cyclase [Acidobacteriota bacterium]